MNLTFFTNLVFLKRAHWFSLRCFIIIELRGYKHLSLVFTVISYIPISEILARDTGYYRFTSSVALKLFRLHRFNTLSLSILFQSIFCYFNFVAYVKSTIFRFIVIIFVIWFVFKSTIIYQSGVRKNQLNTSIIKTKFIWLGTIFRKT